MSAVLVGIAIFAALAAVGFFIRDLRRGETKPWFSKSRYRREEDPAGFWRSMVLGHFGFATIVIVLVLNGLRGTG